jgi:DNA-binding transcriptional regulator of glucitol operon
MQQNKGRALQLAEKLIRGEFCNKGTALAGPQMQQNKGRALQLAEKLIRGEFCNKGTALAGPQMQQNKGRASQLAEKLVRGEFCNKGTALAGPQMQQNKGRALAPAGLSSESSPSFRTFSAACLAPERCFETIFHQARANWDSPTPKPALHPKVWEARAPLCHLNPPHRIH